MYNTELNIIIQNRKYVDKLSDVLNTAEQVINLIMLMIWNIKAYIYIYIYIYIYNYIGPQIRFINRRYSEFIHGAV